MNGVPGFRDADHDALLALVKWTENGTAPEHIIATKWANDTLQDKVLRQRPLCPYPQQAKFVTGDPDLAENVSTPTFTCDRRISADNPEPYSGNASTDDRSRH